jgi:hypothetical protein
MSFETGDIIYISIYSIDYLLKCNVADSSDNQLILNPVSGKTDMLQIYDPVVIVSNKEGQIKPVPGDIASIDKRAGQFVLNVRDLEVNQERRVFERYPVSLAISARRKYSSKRLHMLVRNISLYGMGVISPVDLEPEELIDIDLITDRGMFYFNGKIVWKNRLCDEYFEYGMQLTNYDIATQYQFQEYLNKLSAHYEYQIPRSR